jgi:hypothetical protein
MENEMEKCTVDSIIETGTEGFYVATLSIGRHIGAMIIIGQNLTECVVRVNVVLEAFKSKQK